MSKDLLNDELLLDLKIDIFHRAKIFINDMGNFSPFGSELMDAEIKPVVIYDDSEKVIEGLKLVNQLKDNFSEKLRKNTIQAAAVAYDVFINVTDSNNEIVKRNALCLTISTDGKDWSEDYYLYQIINNECTWD